MIVVVPVDIPVTIPVEEPTVPTAPVLLVHEPPGVLFDKEIEEPTHTLVGPTMGPAADITVIVIVAAQPATR